MKYAVLSVAGAIGMGLSSIAAGVDKHSAGHFFAAVSFLIMVAGAGMVVRSGILELKQEKERKGQGGGAGGAGAGPSIPE